MQSSKAMTKWSVFIAAPLAMHPLVEKTFFNARVFDCRMANDAASISCGLANMV
jgi:hypothetical protein